MSSSVRKCLRNFKMSSTVLQGLKNLQTVQIVIRITLTTIMSVLSKHILHTLSNVSLPIGRSGDVMKQKTLELNIKNARPFRCRPILFRKFCQRRNSHPFLYVLFWCSILIRHEIDFVQWKHRLIWKWWFLHFRIGVTEL